MMDRREFVTGLSALALSAASGSGVFAAGALMDTPKVITKEVPKSGEALPVIGMGSSRTFDMRDDQSKALALTEVLQIFFDQGGTLIDSSPMYGSAEATLGQLLPSVEGGYERLFAATKVWIDGAEAGVAQMAQSFSRMGVEVMDLMQIHNLRDWQAHLPNLRAMKAEGTLRYIGITTSHGRNHDELAEILKTEDLDFVQLSYSIDERTTEQELLPIAQDKGIAVLANRPFRRGETFKAVKDTPLPDWAAEIQCESWAQVFLKYAASHPAVTCVIPATAKPKHMLDNMGAGQGLLPDQAMRAEMLAFFEAL